MTKGIEFALRLAGQTYVARPHGDRFGYALTPCDEEVYRALTETKGSQ